MDNYSRLITFFFFGTRLLLKTGIIYYLYISGTEKLLLLAASFLLTEITDAFIWIFKKNNPFLNRAAAVIFSVSTVIVYTAVAFANDSTLAALYLLLLFHILTAYYMYGTGAGAVSTIFSLSAYSLCLYINHAPFPFYTVIPFMVVMSTGILLSDMKLNRVQKKLDDLMNVDKSKKDFIAIASHNLRTPVASISGYVELLQNENTGSLNESQKLYLNRIRGIVGDMQRIAEQLLQISILEVRKEISLEKQPCQLEPVITEIVSNLSEIARERNIGLNYSKGTDMLPVVYIDIEKVKSVIINLIDNALKYTEQGEIRVTAAPVDKTIRVAVRDTGAGIPKSDMPKIFTKFYRAGNILVYNKPGTGLGLYLSKKIIERHGGAMWLESEEGKGSTFYFTIPLSDETAVLS